MSHMTHRQKQAAAKADQNKQREADALRIAWEAKPYNEDKLYHQARRRQEAANDSGETLSAALTFFGVLVFVGAVLWLLQDDPNPNLIHCIGTYYQPITTTNLADCRRG